MGAKIIFPNDVLQAIIVDYKEGMYSDDILLKYRLNRKVLYRILTENNIPRRINDKKTFSDVLVKAIIFDYQMGLGRDKLSQKYDISGYFVARILKENNIRMRSQTKDKVIAENIKKLILDDYNNGCGFKRIYQKYNVAQKLLDKLLTENEIIRHPKHGNGATRREFNFNFFNEDTPLTAYWAGFIMADGCISKPKTATFGAGHRLQIAVNKIDAIHLQQFLIDVKHCMADVPLEINPSNQQVRICVCHPILLDSLKRWSVIPRKSYNFVEPNIPDRLLRYYLLGWFDGDGSLCMTETTKSLNITGNSEALNWYFSALQKIGYDSRFSFWNPEGQSWGRLSISGMTKIMKVVNVFFPEPTFCLQRKWAKVLELRSNEAKNCKICRKLLTKANRTNVCADCIRLFPNKLKRSIGASGWDDSYRDLLPTELINKSTIVSTSAIDAPLLANLSIT